MIVGQDWSDREVTVSIEELWLVRDAEPTTAVAVPGAELPGPSPVEFSPGSEGGGGGSEARIRLTMPFLLCPDGAGDLPIGVYRAAVLLTLDDCDVARSMVGDVQVYVGGYEAATAAS